MGGVKRGRREKGEIGRGNKKILYIISHRREDLWNDFGWAEGGMEDCHSKQGTYLVG